jgi:HD-like signal output (HDOD) protein
VKLAPLEINYDTFLRENFVLPPLPGALTKVLDAVNSASMGAAEVAKLISPDAAMVSHLLKVVNSAYYGLPKPIAEVKFAIAYLGLAEVSRITLTLSVIKTLKPKEKDQLEHYWMHSYLTAITARHLVKRLKNVFEIGDLYSAALLHDMGKLIYQRFFPEHYSALSRYCKESGKMFVDAEEHFGMPSHLTFGALACDHWHLPRSIRRACEFHELVHLQSIDDPSKADSMDVAVTSANLLASLATDPLDTEIKQQCGLMMQPVIGAVANSPRLLDK